MTVELIDHLADVIQRYNKEPYPHGGRRPHGVLVLQRGRRPNIPLDPKRIPKRG